MEQKCISSADIDSIGCHSNIKTTTATTAAADTPQKIASSAPYLRSPQMSSKKDDLQLQPHKNSFCDKKIFENYEILKQNLNEKEDCESNNGRSCSLSISTPAADNIRLFKDEDSRSGSSDDVTTPHVDLHYLHQRHKQQNGGTECNDDETPTSTNTLQVIQDHRRCHELENTVGVGGVGIYLETPVVDEQIVGLNSHDYEKAKPKRLSDEFLLSSEDCCDDERNSSNDSNPLAIHSSNSNKVADCSVSNSMISTSQRTNDIQTNDILDLLRAFHTPVRPCDIDGGDSVGAVGYPESQFEAADEDIDVQAAPSGSMSYRFKHINIDYNPFNTANDGLTDADAIPSDIVDNDVQSMDAIERRDFEHEQRLTGGIILKSSSIAKNDRLKLELLQPNIQNAKNDERAVSSDSKCTYKDHSTTPTSSRHCSSRLTKSTAKINLTSSLSHSEILTNGDEREHKESQNQEDELLDNNSTSPNDLHHKVQQEDEPGTSKSIQESSLSSSTSSAVGSSSSKNISKRPLKLRSAPLEGPGKSFFDLFSNGNSNDSLTSEHSYSTSSSHSLSHLTKQQEPGCSGVSSSSSLNPDEELIKKDEEAETNQALQEKSDMGNDDDVATTSSSARCQYPALKYIRNSQRKDSLSVLNGEDVVALNNVRPVQRRVISPSSTVSAIFALAATNGSNFQQQLNYEASTVHHNGADQPQVENEMHENEFDEETWADCEEGSDEEVCTCHKDSFSSQGKRDTSDILSEECLSKDVELSSYIQMVSISEDTISHEQGMSPEYTGLQRKRKFNESRIVDTDNYLGDPVSGRKRIAYDYSSTPRSSQSVLLIASPSTPLGRRTPRSIIPTRDNPPPELQDWLLQFQRWSHAERLLAVDRLIEHCEPTQVRHMMKVIEPQFQRDFISLLPRELALQVLAYLDPKDLLRAGQTCRSWRFLCDDNLLWKEKCRKAQILTEPKTDRPKRGRAGNMPPIASPWKAAYMRQHIIESNWRSRPIREPKVLKGHDDHVITCLQFSGNRIVSGSDDNTLKVWSAVTGRCLRTLVGHTGGVWSSQMSGNIIISGSTDRTLKVWDMESGACVHTLLGHTSTVRCMHLHGKKVVSGSRDATLRVWDIERGSCLHVLVGHLAAVRCVQYDGKLIVSGAYDYMVKIWHPERQECLHTLQGHTNRVYSLQFDGVHVVSGSLDTSIRVWDVETGNCKHTLMGHQSLTSGMELRQNILVSGNADSTVKVWDITNGQCLQTLSGPNKHQSAVTCLQFNSRFVITSSDDGTVKLWDVKTGEFIRNLVALDSGGSGGVVWRIRANDTKLICAVGSRNGTEETKLMVLDFDVEGACVKCS